MYDNYAQKPLNRKPKAHQIKSNPPLVAIPAPLPSSPRTCFCVHSSIISNQKIYIIFKGNTWELCRYSAPMFFKDRPALWTPQQVRGDEGSILHQAIQFS